MKLDKTKNFIVTKDESSANILLANGLTLVNKNSDNLFTFVNEPKKMVFDFEKMPIRFTNKLYF